MHRHEPRIVMRAGHTPRFASQYTTDRFRFMPLLTDRAMQAGAGGSHKRECADSRAGMHGRRPSTRIGSGAATKPTGKRTAIAPSLQRHTTRRQYIKTNMIDVRFCHMRTWLSHAYPATLPEHPIALSITINRTFSAFSAHTIHASFSHGTTSATNNSHNI